MSSGPLIVLRCGIYCRAICATHAESAVRGGFDMAWGLLASVEVCGGKGRMQVESTYVDPHKQTAERRLAVRQVMSKWTLEDSER